MKTIMHICRNEEWNEALELGEYKNPSLETEGFIHFSDPEQVLSTANRYYPGQTDLVVLIVDAGLLAAELRYDPVRETHFPHLYGSLNLSAVVAVKSLTPDEAGQFTVLPVL